MSRYFPGARPPNRKEPFAPRPSDRDQKPPPAGEREAWSPAAARADWAGGAFLGELRALGAEVLPAEGGPDPSATLVLGCFLRPRAYSGRIGYAASERRAAQGLIRRFPRSAAVAFGSPFVLERFSGLGAALCAFSGREPAQRAAARALMGRTAVRGRMPVTLSLKETTWR